MNFLLRKRAGMALVVLVLAAVLVSLAILQYRWSVQASEAGTQRMEAALHASLSNFREDLSREFAAICLELERSSADVSRDGKSISERLVLWRRTAGHPTLVADVYIWQVTSSGKDI